MNRGRDRQTETDRHTERRKKKKGEKHFTHEGNKAKLRKDVSNGVKTGTGDERKNSSSQAEN